MTTFYRPKSLQLLERFQNQFDDACCQGDLNLVRQSLNYGASMSGRGLGLSARYPCDLTVFRWLLQHNCPVTTDTWKVIVNSEFSIVYTRAIARHYGHSILYEAGRISAYQCDTKLFKFVVDQIGWQIEFMTALIWSSSSNAVNQYRLIQWAIHTFDVDITSIPSPPSMLNSGLPELDSSSDSLTNSNEETFEVIDVT